jgi:hypothetical protein
VTSLKDLRNLAGCCLTIFIFTLREGRRNAHHFRCWVYVPFTNLQTDQVNCFDGLWVYPWLQLLFSICSPCSHKLCFILCTITAEKVHDWIYFTRPNSSHLGYSYYNCSRESSCEQCTQTKTSTLQANNSIFSIPQVSYAVVVNICLDKCSLSCKNGFFLITRYVYYTIVLFQLYHDT